MMGGGETGRLRAALSVLVGLLCAVTGSKVQANEPRECMGSGFILPADGATGVPTNAWIFMGDSAIDHRWPWPRWLRGADGSKHRLRLASELDDDPPYSSHSFWGPSDLIIGFVPQGGLLRPHMTYQLLAGGELLTTFTTGAEPDYTPPEPPLLLWSWPRPSLGSGSSCDPGGGHGYQLSGEGALMVAVTGREPDGPRWNGIGGVADASSKHRLRIPARRGPRSGRSKQPDGKMLVAFGAIDIAGNRSKLGDPSELSMFSQFSLFFLFFLASAAVISRLLHRGAKVPEPR